MRIASFSAVRFLSSLCFVIALSGCSGEVTSPGENVAETAAAVATGASPGSVVPTNPTPGAPEREALCGPRDLDINELKGDARDIWLGLETAETGKQTGRNPRFELTFSGSVRRDWLKWAVGIKPLAGTSCATPDVQALVSPGGATISYPSADWSVGNVGTSAQRYPKDFQLFAFGDVTGFPSVSGPIAAGGKVALTNGSLNTSRTFPYAIVTNGSVSMSTGSVLGNVSYGTTLTAPQSVYVSGTKKKQWLFDVAGQKASLLAVSRGIAGQTPSGATSVGSDKSVRFVGVQSDVNVFTIAASQFTGATSITVNTPAGAGVLINVTGTAATIANLGITLQGATADKILWNFAQATSVNLYSIGFQGSLLAPLATVNFSNGSMAGQVVANNIGGNGAFNPPLFSGWQALGYGTKTVTLTTTQPLTRECTYALQINGPLNEKNSCLAAPLSLPFVVAKDSTPPLFRDSVVKGRSADRKRVTYFVPKSGINTRVTDIFSQYASELGIPPGDRFVSIGSWKAPELSRTREFFRQEHLGVSVEGGSFVIDEEFLDGQLKVVRSVHGSVVLNVPSDVVFLVPAATAEATALAAAKATLPYPWTISGSKYQAPTTTRLLQGTGTTRQLVWHVNLASSGLIDVDFVDVDAKTGAVIGLVPRRREAECAVTAPTLLTPVQKTIGSGTGALNFSYVRYADATNVEGRLVSPPPYSSALIFPTGPDFPATSIVGYEVFTGKRTELKEPGLDALQGVCDKTENWVAESEERAALLYSERMSSLVTGKQFEFAMAGAPVKAWKGVTGDDEANQTILKIIVSAEQSWGNCPDGRGGGCPVSQRPFNTAFASDDTSPLRDPFVYFNPSLSNPGKLGETFVRAEVVGHELGHVIERAARVTLGFRTPGVWFEDGAISEGFGDIMGQALRLDLYPYSTDWTVRTRNIADPKLGTPPNPDTYLADAYCTAVIPPCDAHVNSTILSHWFYLLATGDNGDGVNDKGCTYDVKPPKPAPAERFDQALRIAFYGVTQGMGETVSFEELRSATLVQAETYGDDAVRATAEAWYAVGVGDSPLPNADGIMTPELGAVIPGWIANIRFEVNDSLPWEIQVATELSFAAGTVVATVDASEFGVSNNGVTRTLGADVTLPSTSGLAFTWRVRPKATKPWPAGPCLMQSFFTIDPSVKVAVPSTNISGVLDADPKGSFLFEAVNGAAYYTAAFSETLPSGCTNTPANRVYDNSSGPMGPFLKTIPISLAVNNPTLYANRFFNPSGLYYLAIASVTVGDGVGPCTIVPFHLAPSAVPILGKPLDNDFIRESTGAFTFYPAGNERTTYELKVFRNGVLVWDEKRDVAQLLADTPGPIAPGSTFHFAEYHNTVIYEPSGSYTWNITAIDGDGLSSAPSETRRYRLGASAPVLLSPAYGEEVPAIAYDFTWSAKRGTSFVLESGTFTGFGSPPVPRVTRSLVGSPGSTQTYRSGVLPPNGDFWWKVTASMANETNGPWTEGRFITGNPDDLCFKKDTAPGTYFTSPAGAIDFQNWVEANPSLCTQTLSEQDPEHPRLVVRTYSCDPTVFQTALEDRRIPVFGSTGGNNLFVNWWAVDKADHYRALLTQVGGGKGKFFDTRALQTSLTVQDITALTGSPLVAGSIYSLSLTPVDPCGQFGSAPDMAVVYWGG